MSQIEGQHVEKRNLQRHKCHGSYKTVCAIYLRVPAGAFSTRLRRSKGGVMDFTGIRVRADTGALTHSRSPKGGIPNKTREKSVVKR